MKKSIFILLVIILPGSNLLAQQENQPNNYAAKVTTKDYDHYLKKSRNNRTASICLVSGGFVIAGIGALTFPKDYDVLFENSAEKENKADVATALIVVGCAAMLTSIPFTIMSGVNKRKAKLLLSNQKTGQRLPPGIGNNITGMTITIPIGK